MTIDEAIEIKSRAAEEYLPVNPVKLVEADRLSIKALRAIRDIRQKHPTYTIELLPGETKD